MKRLFASLIFTVAAVALSGCYLDPGYSYVRQNGYQGDTYYGRSVRTYDDGYYGYYGAPAYGGYYGNGYGYGCCYTPGVSLGISGVWYGGSYYRDGRGYRGHGHNYRGGQWRGRYDGARSDNHRDDRRRSGDRHDRQNDH